METELRESLGPEYGYNKLVDLEDRSHGLMVLLKGKVKPGSSVKTKLKIFLRKSLVSKTLTQRKHIAQKERQAAINRELLFVSFCLISKKRKCLRT